MAPRETRTAGRRLSLLLAAAGGLSSVGARAPQYPIPEVQTPAQRAVVARWRAEAQVASDAATPDVLAFFDSPMFREAIRECCPKAAAMSPGALLERFRAEVRAAELAHMFPSTNDTKVFLPGADFQIALGMQYRFFLNGYQATLVTGAPASAAAAAAPGLAAALGAGAGRGPAPPAPIPNIMDWAETALFGCPHFANASRPTWEEASDRLVYVAHNFRQLDTGSAPFFGDATAIFNSRYVKDMLVMSPVDTGYWEMACNMTEPPMTPGFKAYLDCDEWRPTLLATIDHFDHIILPNWGLWRRDYQGNLTSVYDQVKEAFARSPFAEASYAELPNMSQNSFLKYWETNLLGNPRFPEGIRFLIGSFAQIFGTSAGRSLQAFADEFGWPLVWAQSALFHEQHRGPPASLPSHDRILDPTVNTTALLNTTVPASAVMDFGTLWDIVGQGRANATDADFAAWWAALADSQMRVAPVTAHACAEVDDCVGTDQRTGDCICRKGTDASMLVV